jgi:nucleolar GTP-binding protein
MIRALTKEHMEGIRHCSSVDEVVKTRSAYLGRVSSVMRQLDKHLEMLNKARDILRNLPSIDDELFTVAIAGFPNVGKSTLLSKITTAKPEIKAYAFTTKGLNVGYFEYKYNKIQCVDTPGTLDRIKPNDIERKADATIKYLAHLVVYVVDPTEGGYSLAQQHQLYDKTDRLGKRMLVYVSKADVMDKATIQSVLDKYPDSTCDPAILRAAIVKAFKEEFV